jgi:ribosomal protein S18 acetylase RimI-like enzyme
MKCIGGITLIKEITDREKKSTITSEVLRSLPEWFGIEKAVNDYIMGVRGKPFYAAYDDTGNTVGFICIESHNEFTAEIYLMGILPESHRMGYGGSLVRHAARILAEDGYGVMMVKTLGMSRESAEYEGTRLFYRACGFMPLQELTGIWDENPCLIMVKNL